jgi:hypothetical protein
MEVITNQLEGAQDVKVDTKMFTLKPKVCSWLLIASYNHTTKFEMVKKGWHYTGASKSI